jgi:hypothetical protein
MADPKEGTPEFRKRRNQLEDEVRGDLKKSVIQLTVDVYDEVLKNGGTVEEHQIHALKRFSAIMAKSIISNDQLGQKMLWLTVAIAFLTLLMLYKMIFP